MRTGPLALEVGFVNRELGTNLFLKRDKAIGSEEI